MFSASMSVRQKMQKVAICHQIKTSIIKKRGAHAVTTAPIKQGNDLKINTIRHSQIR